MLVGRRHDCLQKGEMSEHEERLGRNEALFRQINERLEELQQSNAAFAQEASFICECGDRDCAGQMTMTLSEYERLRADPRLFAVIPGHEIPDVEDVVERREGYDVVRKHAGTPAEVATEEDPRD